MNNKKTFFAITILTLTLLSWNAYNKSNDEKSLIVLVRYKAQPSKAKETIQALDHLIEKVSKEPNFISITLHIEKTDSTNILLYEEWSDESYYSSAHMQTEHLQKFIENSRNFLAGPPEISFWKVDQEYK